MVVAVVVQALDWHRSGVRQGRKKQAVVAAAAAAVVVVAVVRQVGICLR